MKAGEFPDGARTLRAKIDMTAPNVWLRDPVLYRIRHAAHHHTGDKWCIYPMYDWAHTLSDYIEGHHALDLHAGVRSASPALRLDSGARSICRGRFRISTNLRGSISTYTVMSKRKLIQLVNEKLVTGWDDPRMPTISGLRRRGVTASALRNVRLQHRHHEISEHDRHGRARTRHPRGIQSQRAAPSRRAAADQGRDDELSGRKRSRNSMRSIIPRIQTPERAKFHSAASSTSSAMISWKRRRRNISGFDPAAKCG